MATTASEIKDVLAAIKAKLLTVDGLAQSGVTLPAPVFTYIRKTQDEAAWVTAFSANGFVNGWEMFVETTKSKVTMTNRIVDRSDFIVLRGYYAVADAPGGGGDSSEVLFRQGIVERVLKVLNKDQSIGGKVKTHGGANVRRYLPITTRGAAIMHYAEVTLEVEWVQDLGA